MNRESEFAAYVVDQMQSIGLVCAKRMFGGYGIFLGGLMFALIADAALYLKVDAQSAVDFESRGLGRFRDQKKGKNYSMGYFQAPEVVLEDTDEMQVWGDRAFAAALRAAVNK